MQHIVDIYKIVGILIKIPSFLCFKMYSNPFMLKSKEVGGQYFRQNHIFKQAIERRLFY